MTPKQPADWRTLGRVAPQELAPTRLALHWAVQVPTAGAISLLPHQADYSQTGLTWNPPVNALLTHPIERFDGIRIGLRLPDMSVVLVDGDTARSTFALEGRTLQESYDALGQSLSHLSGQSVVIQPSDYTLPDHPVKDGGRWEAPDTACLSEFASLYHNADRFLRAYRDENPDASPAVVWPHHFDFALITVFDPEEADPEKARSIGVGFSPGDDTYAEPYVYVLPWPHLDPQSLPELGTPGRWHTQGFVAAVLTTREWLTTAEADQQSSRLSDFVERAVAAAKLGLQIP